MSGLSDWRIPKRQWVRLLLGAALALYGLSVGFCSVRRFQTYHAATFDLGYFSQVVWNTANGRWFETTISRSTSSELIGNYLGEHVTPVLMLIAPLYRLWPDPRLLLVLQTAGVASGALPLFALARRVTGKRTHALIVALGYLAYPALGFVNLFDFHPIALSIPAVFLAAWALEEGRGTVFWAAVLLALFTKEELVVPLGAWAATMVFRADKRRTGARLLGLVAIWAVVSIGVIIPRFNEGEGYKFLGLWSRLPWISAAPAQAGVAQATGPASAQAVVLFLVHLFLPLGFLPFLGLHAFIVALPSLAYLLLGQRAAFHSVGYHYPAVLIPWLFLAVVEGMRCLKNSPAGRASRYRRLGLIGLLAGTLGTNLVLNPFALSAKAGFFQRPSYHEHVDEALARIPKNAAVSVVNRFGPHLANRRILVALEYPPPLRLEHVKMTDYVLLDLVDCRTVPAANQREAFARMVKQILDSGSFRVDLWEDRILLLEKGSPTEGELSQIRAYVDRLVEEDRPCWP